jgi:hypothetical protein
MKYEIKYTVMYILSNEVVFGASILIHQMMSPPQKLASVTAILVYPPA